MLPVQRFIVTIEGPGWSDLDELELADLPNEGEPIQTKLGLCLVTHADRLPEGDQHDGRIVCRLP
jgi:hypothetical protein